MTTHLLPIRTIDLPKDSLFGPLVFLAVFFDALPDEGVPLLQIGRFFDALDLLLDKTVVPLIEGLFEAALEIMLANDPPDEFENFHCPIHVLFRASFLQDL